jgi:hypothetical protein
MKKMRLSLQDLIAYVLAGAMFAAFAYLAIASRRKKDNGQENKKKSSIS